MTLIANAKPVGLYTDLAAGVEPPQVGDWIATEAGARYLVVEAHHVNSVKHPTRWRTRCMRLERGCPVPDDVHCIWMTWYPRGRR